MHQKASLGIFSLAMLIIGAIDSIRNLPAAALFGTSLVFFFIIAACLFLLPIAFVSAELTTSIPDEPGIFGWIRHTFGEKAAVGGVWLQWINTMVWFPTILSFMAGAFAYLINPQLAEYKWFLVSVVIITIWVFTLINLRGVNTSARIASVCTFFGMILPMASIIVLAGFWISTKPELNIHFGWDQFIPSFDVHKSWVSLTAIMTSFVGIELATVHVTNVGKPQRDYPWAIFLSVAVILITMILGSLAIAVVIPPAQINLVDGTMQALSTFLRAYHLQVLIPVYALFLFFGTLGGLVNWLISPAKGLYQVAEAGYLPKKLAQVNRHGVAYWILLLQALVISGVCSSFLLLPSVNGGFWFLTDLSTELYMILYAAIFVAAIYIRYREPFLWRPFKVGKSRLAMTVIASFGLLGCLITLLVGFVPPANIEVGGIWWYELLFVSGLLLLIAPVKALWQYRERQDIENLRAKEAELGQYY